MCNTGGKTSHTDIFLRYVFVFDQKAKTKMFYHGLALAQNLYS